MTRLILKTEPTVPLEADTITPDHFLGKTAAEISALPLLYGNEKVPLGDFFSVLGDGSAEITLEGDLRRVKWIGARMTQGRIIIRG
ncbi:MAG: formylmethanofuran dehydrogenase subunit C, partial [Anaerolineae bacterium]|nr:formylmethanofuran dehydrogenase subunit C [Anaerolineae bacterium]